MEVTADIPERAWSDFLDRAPGASPYQSPALMQVYARTDGFRPYVLAVEGPREIRALLAFVIVSYFGGPIPKLASRSLAVGGPLGEADAFPALFAAQDTIAGRATVLSQIRNLVTPQDKPIFEAAGYTWQDHLNYIVDLRGGESSILRRMFKGRRKHIASADRSGIELLEARSSNISIVYELLKQTHARAKIPLAPRDLFEHALDVLAPRGQLWCLLATFEGTPCAARLVLRWKDVIYDWYAGSSDSGKAHHANEWLVWQILKRGIEENCKAFDFGGAGAPREVYGPGEFKREFGGARTNPGRFEKEYHPLALKASMTAYRIWRKLPR